MFFPNTNSWNPLEKLQGQLLTSLRHNLQGNILGDTIAKIENFDRKLNGQVEETFTKVAIEPILSWRLNSVASFSSPPGEGEVINIKPVGPQISDYNDRVIFTNGIATSRQGALSQAEHLSNIMFPGSHISLIFNAPSGNGNLPENPIECLGPMLLNMLKNNSSFKHPLVHSIEKQIIHEVTRKNENGSYSSRSLSLVGHSQGCYFSAMALLDFLKHTDLIKASISEGKADVQILEELRSETGKILSDFEIQELIGYSRKTLEQPSIEIKLMQFGSPVPEEINEQLRKRLGHNNVINITSENDPLIHLQSGAYISFLQNALKEVIDYYQKGMTGHEIEREFTEINNIILYGSQEEREQVRAMLRAKISFVSKNQPLPAHLADNYFLRAPQQIRLHVSDSSHDENYQTSIGEDRHKA